MKLAKMADCRANLPRILKLRLLLISVFLVINIIELILSQADTNFWLSQDAFLSFLLLFPAILSIFQIICFRTEYRKRVPYNFFNGILWVIYCVFNITLLVILALNQNNYLQNYFVFFMKALVSGVLLVISIFKYQDYTEFYHLKIIDTIKLSHLLLAKQSNLINKKILRVRKQFEMSNIGQQPKYIEIQKELKYENGQSDKKVYFNLAIKTQKPAKIIKHEQQEILIFLRIPKESVATKNYAQRIQFYQQFINYKIQQQGCSKQILQFLQTQLSDLASLIHSYQQDHLLGTDQNLQQQDFISQEIKSILFLVHIPSYVKVSSHIQYPIEIKLGRLKWQVRKRFAQFDQIKLQLKSYGLKTIAIYKGKDLQKRKLALQNFCSNTLNQKVYWKPQLWKFFNMEQQVQQIMRYFQVSQSLKQSHTIVKITSQQSAIDQNGKLYVVYLIQVNHLQHRVKRRYNDFSKLHKVISSKLPDIKLPILPSKKNKQQRIILLQNYLQQLLSIRSVHDSQQIESFLGLANQSKQQTTGSIMSRRQNQSWMEDQRRLHLLNKRYFR